MHPRVITLPGPVRSFTAKRAHDARKAMGGELRARPGRGRRRRRGSPFQSFRRYRLRARMRPAVRTRHHPQSSRRRPSFSRPIHLAELGVRMKQTPTAWWSKASDRAIDDFDRARHHLASRLHADDARGWSARGSLPHLVAADRLSRLLPASTRPSAINCSPPAWISRARGRSVARRSPRRSCPSQELPRHRLSRSQPEQPQSTDHRFTGDYPTRLVDQFGDPARQQLSLLAEAI